MLPPDEHDAFAEEPPSKSEIKREAERLKKIGEKLLALSNEQLAVFTFPEVLEQAIAEGKRIKSREGLRRHKQFIGKLLREADTEAIESQLSVIENARTLNTRAFHELELLRDQLIDGDNSDIGAVIARFSAVDTQKLRQLVRNAKKASDDKTHHRKLFRYLRELAESQ